MDLLEKMATYVRVLEAGSFSAAAKQLRISPAAVSRQIATLEDELAVTLVLRSTRRMAITEAGHRYYERCLRILREVEEAQAVGRDDALQGLLKLNAPVTFGLECVVPYMHPLMTQHPGLRVDLRLEDRLVDLALDDVDLAIRVGGAAPESHGVIGHRLAAFRRVLVASPAYLKQRGEPQSPEALAGHEALAHFAGGAGDHWMLTQAGRDARVRINVAFRSNALHALRALARSGAGIALLPAWLVIDDVKRGSLRRVLAGWETEPVIVLAIHRTEHRGTPRVRAVVDHLRKAYTRDYPALKA